jgi:hypothetical protein
MIAVKVILWGIIISAFIPVGAGVSYFPRLKLDTKILVVLFGITFLVDATTIYFSFKTVNINWIQHFYTPVAYIFLVTVFALWQERPIIKKAYIWSIPVFVLICFRDISDTHNLQYSNDFTAALSCAIYILATSHFLVNIERREGGTILRNYRFWILAGLLIYSAGSLAYFAFFRLFYSYFVWGIHGVLDIVTNIFFATGIICQIRWD